MHDVLTDVTCVPQPILMGGADMTSSHQRYSHLSKIARPASGEWPHGKKLAFYVAIGFESYRFGEGQVEDLMPGVPTPDLVNTSWRDYGNRVGGFRLLRLLEQLKIPPTILLNSAACDESPELIAQAQRQGAEFVGHGISNSDCLAGMDQAQERAYLQQVAARIGELSGVQPQGWSSPWLTHTPHTIDLLGECGYRYLMDLRLDDRPVWLQTRKQPLLAMPYALELNDSTSMVGRQVDAHTFADMVIDEFDELLKAAEDEPLVMSLVLHSFISGAPFRLKQVRLALTYIQQHSEVVWLTQPSGIYAAVQSPETTLLGGAC